MEKQFKKIEKRLDTLEKQIRTPEIVGSHQAAQKLGISYRELMRITAAGEITYIQKNTGKRGSKLFFTKSDLKNYANSKKKLSIRGLLEGIEQKLTQGESK